MIVAINTAELQALIRQHMESGRSKDDDVILQALRCSEAEEAKCQEERRQAIERLKTFGKTHRLSLGGISIRELINEGRR